jgi:hypothetical protein
LKKVITTSSPSRFGASAIGRYRKAPVSSVTYSTDFYGILYIGILPNFVYRFQCLLMSKNNNNYDDDRNNDSDSDRDVSNSLHMESCMCVAVHFEQNTLNIH